MPERAVLNLSRHLSLAHLCSTIGLGYLSVPYSGIHFLTYLSSLSNFSSCEEGLNTLKTGLSQLIKNEIPAYEMISGAAIAFAALLLIIPGFATDIIGFLLIFPLTRKLIFGKISKNLQNEKKNKNEFIEGEFEDLDDDNRKL